MWETECLPLIPASTNKMRFINVFGQPNRPTDESAIDFEGLKEDLKVIFDNANSRDDAGFGYQLLTKILQKNQPLALLKVAIDSTNSEKFESYPDMYVLNFEYLDILIQIYNRISHSTLAIKSYEQYLGDQVGSSLAPHVALAALIKIGRVDLATGAFENRLKSGMSYNHHAWEFLTKYIKYEYSSISELDLKMYRTLVDSYLSRLENNYNKTAHLFRTQVLECQLKKLHHKYADVNSEINQHKVEIIHKIEKFNLGGDLITFIHNVDQVLNQTSILNEAVVSGIIGDLREFMKNMVQKITVKIIEKTGIQLPPPKDITEGEMGRSRRYLKDQLGLTENEDKFINNFIKILHEKGGHSFNSEKEYLRLSRSFVIELNYFLLLKYEKKFG